MPAVAAVEELRPTRTKGGEDMLEIRSRGGKRPERRGMKGPATERKHAQSREPAGDLERTVRDVAMWNPIREQVERDAEQDGEQTRPSRRARGRAARNVQGHDHRPLSGRLVAIPKRRQSIGRQLADRAQLLDQIPIEVVTL